MSDQKLARALGSKIRRDIFHILIGKESPVHDIADTLGLSEVTASKHLTKLFDLGFLNSRNEGREKFYSIKIIEIEALFKEYDAVAKKLGGP